MEKENYGLLEKIHAIHWMLQKNARSSAHEDISRGQGRVMKALAMQAEVSSKDLAFILDIRQQSLNELLSKLEKKGFVQRTPSESDKRVLMVSLTEEGRKHEPKEMSQNTVFDCLTEEEQKQLAQYLEKIIVNLEAGMDESEKCARQEWMNEIRNRMGDEKFESFMKMQRGFMGGCGRHGGPQGGHGGPRFHHMQAMYGRDLRFFGDDDRRRQD